MKLVGLSRQIALTMMAMAFGVTLLFLLTSYAFYFFLKTYWPEASSSESLMPTGPEWGWMIGTTLAALALSAVVAINLSRRILVPLNSVTDSIRRVAQGELGVRADASDRSLGEAALLADDFNALADKLQRMTEEQTFWNAAISHELRTPVTILRGRLQGLVDGVFTPDASQFRNLLGQVEGLSRLIEDLRVVSLVESGHLDLQWQATDLVAEITSVVEFCSDALRSAGQHPVLNLDGSRRMLCDPGRIQQALLALLDNARQHAVPGEIRIRTWLENGQCSLSVEDDGPGIPADVVPYVFQAFRRAAATRAKTGGSGLGLAIVAAIAQAHGGQTSCRATAKGGTQFIVSWPNKAPLPDTARN
ncbi:HAMP domain-containing histidine kinase [Burkholderia glumae]|uniref:sensor histidine kinase n=1 Tax=Burkholderia glumae TaxID=337 RepID=UPI0013738D99|nr:HAMP domain-containing sensor histidine kinase [Burkholderia glumae]QHP94521.1 HAMP domain-containing histidine kinase [Burkholderia glumae]